MAMDTLGRSDWRRLQVHDRPRMVLRVILVAAATAITPQ
jgi:hypothetical protein